MAIKPMDMQVLLPKLHKNDLLKPHVVNKLQNEQQLMQNVNKQDVQDKLNKVNDFEKKEPPRVRDEGQQSSGQEQSEGKKKKKHSDTPTDKSEKNKTGPRRNHIDIKV